MKQKLLVSSVALGILMAANNRPDKPKPALTQMIKQAKEENKKLA